MQKTESRQLVQSIIEHALKRQFTEFHFITSWTEFRFYKQTARATEIIIKTLKTSSKNIITNYCKDIIKGEQNLNILLAYSQIQDIRDFYEKDLAVLKYMLNEYDEYLGKGNFWYSFFGGEREI